jgi:hypothetical protein
VSRLAHATITFFDTPDPNVVLVMYGHDEIVVLFGLALPVHRPQTMENTTLTTLALLTYSFAAVYALAGVWAWALSARLDARLVEAMAVAARDTAVVARCPASARLLRFYRVARVWEAYVPPAPRFTGLRLAPGTNWARTVPGVADVAPCDLVPTRVGG